MQDIRCQKCNKKLLEAEGEGKKICPKCKELTHYVATTEGVFYFKDEKLIKLEHQN